MDFITNLPASQGHTSVMVVVDRFSKAAHFQSLPHKFTASQAAELFTAMICKLHRYLKSIIFDGDPIFYK